MLRRIFRHVRLLPAVMVLGVVLLGLKTTGLVLEARAQDASAAAPAAQPAAPAPSAEAGDATDDPDSTSAQVDVLTSLAKRRAELDAREQDLDLRANLIAAAENRVDGKIAGLKQLQTQIQALLQQHDAAQQKEINSLVKTYSSMKPKDAARIFNNLDNDVLLSVASEMKPDVLGAILAQMQADAAQKLTVKLADKLKLPDMQAAAATPQQLASTIPTTAPGAPAPATTVPAAPAATGGAIAPSAEAPAAGSETAAATPAMAAPAAAAPQKTPAASTAAPAAAGGK